MNDSGIMVMRTIEMREVSYKVSRRRAPKVIAELKRLYGDRLTIAYKNDIVRVRGDLHNYRMVDRIIWILSGGAHGEDISAG